MWRKERKYNMPKIVDKKKVTMLIHYLRWGGQEHSFMMLSVEAKGSVSRGSRFRDLLYFLIAYVKVSTHFFCIRKMDHTMLLSCLKTTEFK